MLAALRRRCRLGETLVDKGIEHAGKRTACMAQYSIAFMWDVFFRLGAMNLTVSNSSEKFCRRSAVGLENKKD